MGYLRAMAINEAAEDDVLRKALLKYRITDHRHNVLIERLMVIEEVERIINYFDEQVVGQKMTAEAAYKEVKDRVNQRLRALNTEQRNVASFVEQARSEVYAAGGDPTQY